MRRRVVLGLAALVLLGRLLFLTSPASPFHALEQQTRAAVVPELFAGELLVYGRHGFTHDEVVALRKAGGSGTAVHGGELSVRSGRAGYPEVPVEAMTVVARDYANAVRRPALADQLSAGVVLSARGAALRHLSVGGLLRLSGGRTLKVSAVVEDNLLGGFEAAMTPAVLGHEAGSLTSYLLVPASSGVAERLRAALPGRDLRVEASTRNGLMSSADSVLTQAQIKERFGEFALRRTGSSLSLDSTWEQTWIVQRRIPQLGLVACNKAVIGDLILAMREITAAGLGRLVHTADFRREGGCWNPRITRFGGGQISSHAWGIAVDINVDANPLGEAPHQDPRLVAIMARHGFTWGGRFLRPDGAHFEWVGGRVRG